MGADFVADHFVIIALTTMMALWELLVMEQPGNIQKLSTRLLIAIGAFHILMYINSYNRFFENDISATDTVYMLNAVWLLNLLYYTTLIVILVRAPKKKKDYAS